MQNGPGQRQGGGAKDPMYDERGRNYFYVAVYMKMIHPSIEQLTWNKNNDFVPSHDDGIRIAVKWTGTRP